MSKTPDRANAPTTDRATHGLSTSSGAQTKERRRPPAAPSAARALVLRAHPHADSFNSALADAWSDGARQLGVEVQTIDVHDLEFDQALRVAYRGDQPLEPDLARVREQIARAAHLVFAYPTWWGSTPAQLKGLIDRVFLPGWAFVDEGKALPSPGLSGRSARLLVTMDAPVWYDRWLYGAPGPRHMARATLRFCGIKPVSRNVFGGIGKSTAKQRERMLEKARKAGEADGRRLVARFGPAPVASATATAAG